jgi:uncharacterized protein (TIGR02145 family)
MYYRILALTIIVLSFLYGCCKDDKITNPKPNLPVINRIVPDSASIGDIVSIIGTGFDSAQDSNNVYFNSTKATIYKIWNDSLIIVIVPQGATSGKVWVTVKGIKSTEIDFTVIAYEEVTIGTQIWMLKNLDVDHYRNGDSIPEVRDNKQWELLTTGAWCYYNNSDSLGKIYGKLYNWYAVNDPRGLAPFDWHIPSYDEFVSLSIYLGGDNQSGGHLKEAGINHWQIPNFGATNASGFTALPGGYRSSKETISGGSFSHIGFYGNWWSSSQSETYSAKSRCLDYYYSWLLDGTSMKGNGFSVRCIKDE